MRKADIRERTPFRTPHHMNTIPIPAVTNVASAATIVLTEICPVKAVITADQSAAVVAPAASAAKDGKALARVADHVTTGRALKP